VSASRYRHCDPLWLTQPDGHLVRYLAPRILPDVPGPGATTVQASEVDRLDLVAFRALRDPLQAWRIADANLAMDPLGLCRRAGDPLRLPGSQL
jgi:hypothetical protein